MTKKKDIASRCGMVSIVGRPNVGKSTLLNAIVGEKVAIVSKVPQTTRARIRGIYTEERGQIIFTDTPGIVRGKDMLDQCMKKAAFDSTSDVDCIIHLVDTNDTVGQEEKILISRLKDLSVPVVLGLNKVDMKGRYISDYINLWEEIKGIPVTAMKNFIMVPVSGKKGTNLDRLLDVLFEVLPEGPALYPMDTISDTPRNLVISDIVREKLFHALRHELPHSLAVVIEEIKPVRRKTLHIRAVIIVERETQKRIVVGKKGEVLKNVGSLAREELEDLMETKIFLELFVKVRKNWRDSISLLQEMGYDSE